MVGLVIQEISSKKFIAKQILTTIYIIFITIMEI